MYVVRFGRCRLPSGVVVACRLEGDRVQPLSGSLFEQPRPHGDAVALEAVTLLCPVLPSKVVGIGSNYRRHALEMGKPVPAVPKIFVVPSTAVTGPEEPIALPPGTWRVDHEAELGVVIGRITTRVPRGRVADHVFGYTCVNDVTARDFQRTDGVFGRAKGFDGFKPVGPWVATGLDPADLFVRCRVGGVLRQDGRTSDMVFDVATLVEFVSGVMTLLPGDVIATGTPSGVGPLQAGDEVEIEIEGIGVLRNPVVDREDR